MTGKLEKKPTTLGCDRISTLLLCTFALPTPLGESSWEPNEEELHYDVLQLPTELQRRVLLQAGLFGNPQVHFQQWSQHYGSTRYQ